MARGIIIFGPAGSMDSFHESFDPLFDLAVFLLVPVEVRQERIHRRELEQYGDRILPGGDMYEEHRSWRN